MPGELPADGHRVILVRDARGLRTSGDAARVQPVFSVTKMFVAAATLRLAERGAVDLDGELPDGLAGLSAVAQLPRRITVGDLLRHTAGLPDYAAGPAYLAAVAARPGQPWTSAELLAAALGEGGARPPLGSFRYSNTGYWVLGMVLERAAGLPLGDVLRTQVFGPCGMAATLYPEVGSRVTADGYDTRWAGPAGAAWSTALDLDAFLRALAGGGLLAAGSLAMMTKPVPVPPQPPWPRPGYGLGLMVDSALEVLGHGGAGPGHEAAAFIATVTGRSAVVLVSGMAGRGPAGLSAPDRALELLLADPDE